VSEIHFAERRRIIWGGYSLINRQLRLLQATVSENGKLWWYVDGVKTYGGLMLIDGAYYYARSSGEIVTNRGYSITKTNDLLPVAYYKFGADGKMLNPPVK
jgi:hypothetical protein